MEKLEVELHEFLTLTRWRRMVSFTPRSIYPGKVACCTHGIGGRVDYRVGEEAVAKKKSPVPAGNRILIHRSASA
jgi:hypothetical protein